MRHGLTGLFRRPSSAFAVVAAGSALAWSGAVLAQDEPAPSPAATPKVAAPPPPPSDPPAPYTPRGLIEWLPASAFPNDPIRGLEGGSLWLTSGIHGLQWPYTPRTGIGVSGNVWIDTGYETINRGTPNEQGTDALIQQGRFVLRVTPTWSDGAWFVQGQAEFVADKTQTGDTAVYPTADDVWVKMGRWKTFDVEFGRFQGWEVYHIGMGLDLFTQERLGAYETTSGNTAPSIYGVTYAWDRQPGAGGAAIHLYPARWLRFELGSQLGYEQSENTLAGRPVAILDLGWMKLKLGGEWQKEWDQSPTGKGGYDNRGLGAGLIFIADPWVEFGLNGARGWVNHRSPVDGSEDLAGSFTTYSLGAFLNARVIPPLPDFLLGGGFDYTYLQDKQYDQSIGRSGDFDQQQAFVAAQYFLFKQVYVKLVGGYALADFNPSFTNVPSYNNTMWSGRLRVWYFF